jgi:hypothetical protein
MALESPVQRDGDRGFLGFASRLNPLALPAGMLQDSVNMRLDRGVAQTRKGAKRLASDISVSGTPLTVPFILEPAPNEKIVRAVYDGGIFTSALMLLPEENIGTEAVLLAGPDSVFTYITDSALDITSAGAAAVLAVSATENLVTDTNDELLVIALPPEISLPTTPDEIIEPTDKVSMLQAYNRLYLFREADRNQAGWGTNFTSAQGIEVSGTVATVYVDAHGYEQGARVRIEGGAAAAFAGHEYNIASVIDADRFTIEVPSGTPSEAGANTQVRRVKPPLYWDGNPANDFVRAPAGVPAEGPTYKKMRSVPWAAYINNRLILPDGRQNVMISDVLDPDLYDPFWASFRVGKGGNDYIVAVHPWVEGTVLVFCRKSIWLATISQVAATGGNGFDIDSAVSKLELLTDEIGCSARRTIVTAGNFVYFLSDSGVYRLDARLDLKLRGDTKPLSDPIADKLQTLNTDLIEDSVAVYQDNRYYLAVPLADSTDSNDGVFIYSQLNEQWETEDIYGFGVNNFLVGNVAGERRIMITNRAGYLMLLNQREDGDDSPDTTVNVVSPVPASIRTRRYDFGDMHSKRFLRTIADVVIPAGASITTKIKTINPDVEDATIGTLTNTSGGLEDYNAKSPIRYKAHAAEILYETNNGRPEIRGASIEASPKSNPPTETRNAA